MASRVLGSMHQEPQGGRRQARASDLSLGEQDLAWRLADLLERTVQSGVRLADEHREGAAGDGLGASGGELLCGERLAARVCQEALGASGDVPEVEADRCRIAWTLPEDILWKSRRQPIELLLHLEQRVGHGHQVRIDVRKWPPLPDFGGLHSNTRACLEAAWILRTPES
jgi:hypothetical protein